MKYMPCLAPPPPTPPPPPTRTNTPTDTPPLGRGELYHAGITYKHNLSPHPLSQSFPVSKNMGPLSPPPPSRLCRGLALRVCVRILYVFCFPRPNLEPRLVLLFNPYVVFLPFTLPQRALPPTHRDIGISLVRHPILNDFFCPIYSFGRATCPRSTVSSLLADTPVPPRQIPR